MVFIGKYDEFCPGMGFPSLKNSLRRDTYESEAAVLSYLKSGKVHMATTGLVKDVVTGETTGWPLHHMNDGKLCWTTKLIYHIEKYHLQLPEEIEQYILNRQTGYCRKA